MQMPAQWSNFINGQWVGSDQQLPIFNPATGTQIATVAQATTEQATQALDGAQRCIAERRLSKGRPADRVCLLLRVASEIRKIAEYGAKILCLENGKRYSDAHDEFVEAARYFEYYAGMADKIEGVSIPLGDDYVDYTVYEAIGVSVQIVPWNFPVSICARSLAPALAAGNACIVKSPELSPLGLCVLFEALEKAGLPKGAAQLLCGLGSEVGGFLVSSPKTNQIVFTGSVPTGRRIMQAAAHWATPCVMELGGKSAGVVLEDADIHDLLVNIKSGIFLNSGQVCSALSRLLVHRSIYAQVIEAVSTMVKGLTRGDGFSGADITPVISARQQQQIGEMCKLAQEEGARLVVGGGIESEVEGFYVQPTVFADVSPSMTIAQEEVFGPVLCIMPFDTDEEAIAIANGTDYGLVAGVFTNDLRRAMRFTQQLRSGQIFVNEWYAGGIETPFGGVGLSGYGREKGQEALYSYVRTKNIAISLKGQ
ncbi:aldehyde dehydrogenase family protein [Paenalcaligenes niemegkensis]|uniref:aldehyde dehydrogenase family protein n=1 Tax=Paenalcaligenes niemegkensis TaxID=2895469 RepID=UPI001EE7E05E|nr:aldehyde dehydrogenase family protein [Paenalcaligenes niemegkensis]MCQ9617674.1 aldehyde dehydrogenase family protein [Paenalcaligenes niemegkensis]